MNEIGANNTRIINRFDELKDAILREKRLYIQESEVNKKALTPAKLKSAAALIGGIGVKVAACAMMLTPVGSIIVGATAVTMCGGALFSTVDHGCKKIRYKQHKKAAGDLQNLIDFVDSFTLPITRINELIMSVSCRLEDLQQRTRFAMDTDLPFEILEDRHGQAKDEVHPLDADSQRISLYGFELEILWDRITRLRTQVQLKQDLIQVWTSRSDKK